MILSETHRGINELYFSALNLFYTTAQQGCPNSRRSNMDPRNVIRLSFIWFNRTWCISDCTGSKHTLWWRCPFWSKEAEITLIVNCWPHKPTHLQICLWFHFSYSWYEMKILLDLEGYLWSVYYIVICYWRCLVIYADHKTHWWRCQVYCMPISLSQTVPVNSITKKGLCTGLIVSNRKEFFDNLFHVSRLEFIWSIW